MELETLFMAGSALWGIVSLILLFWAWRFAKAGRYVEHRRLMIFLTCAAWTFLSIYVLKSVVLGIDSASVPDHLVPWIAFHGTVGLVPAFVTPVLLWSRLSRGSFFEAIHIYLNRYHRRYGRIVVAVWAVTHIGGVINFFLFS